MENGYERMEHKCAATMGFCCVMGEHLVNYAENLRISWFSDVMELIGLRGVVLFEEGRMDA